jgi:hypothetical protein
MDRHGAILSISLTHGLDTSGLMDAVMVRREGDHQWLGPTRMPTFTVK